MDVITYKTENEPGFQFTSGMSDFLFFHSSHFSVLSKHSFTNIHHLHRTNVLFK